MLTKKLLIPAAVIVFSGIGLASATTIAHAQTTTTNPLSGLVEKIAQKFNLDKSQVQGVFDEYRQEHQKTMQQNMADRLKARLDTLVKDGKITQAQEDAIIAEEKLLKDKYGTNTWQNKTADERKTLMDQMREEWQTWAKSQGLDQTLLGFGGFGGPMRGWGRKGMMMHRVSPTPTP